ARQRGDILAERPPLEQFQPFPLSARQVRPREARHHLRQFGRGHRRQWPSLASHHSLPAWGFRMIKLRCEYLDIAVEVEFVRVGAETNCVKLLLALVAHPGLDEILGEYSAAKQEVMVVLDRPQDLIKGARRRRNFGGLFRW